ncbi:MAG: hypothetical protein QOI86_4664 [Actinomycetota bacterium]|jgi:amino acid transporter|nr:hypothetical protein [Actinomycetota bacterium]
MRLSDCVEPQVSAAPVAYLRMMRYRLDFLPPPRSADLRPWLAPLITAMLVGITLLAVWSLSLPLVLLQLGALVIAWLSLVVWVFWLGLRPPPVR